MKMRDTFLTGVMAAFLCTLSGVAAASSKNCLALRAEQDTSVESPSGIQVRVYGTNRCSEDVSGNGYRFKVSVLSSGRGVIGTQTGHFYGTIASGETAETILFVECDPSRVGSIEVTERD
jgi:hypothetical protein